MARILYGVCGEGMGHAIRSRPIIEYLAEMHEVKIFSSKGALSYLYKNFKDVNEITGQHIKYRDNKVQKLRTVASNILKSLEFFRSFRKLNASIKDFKPDIIISDYEILSAYSALLNGIPLLSIDNQHITRAKLDFPKKYLQEYIETKIISRINIPTARNYMITTFFYPKKIPKNTMLVPPVLRKNILDIKPKEKDFILVYQTSNTNKKLVQELKKMDHKFIVSGFGKEKRERNLRFIRFDEKKFLRYLADCRALITNGGFTLISEALHLGKPVLSIPVVNQFEQTLNALCLDRLGYGKQIEKASREEIKNFIHNLKTYNKNLKKYKKEDNSKLFMQIERIISEVSSS